jgi:flagellar L-ring protein FlgH
VKNVVLMIVAGLVLSGVAGADSLFNAKTTKNGTLVSNKKVRFEVGDLVTVQVTESVSASTESNTNTKKESELSATASAAANTFLVSKAAGGLNIIPKERLPNWNIEAENEHKGTGNTSRKNKLSMVVACSVVRVYPNGNIDIEGEKQVTVNREDSRIVLRGTLRGRDVSPANMVTSDKLANASIELKGRGPLWNNQRRGLFTKLLDWFSPF